MYKRQLQITPLWKGERFPDGRPKVPDDILQRMRNITLEEAWGPLWSEGYKFQFEGDLKCTHEKAKLVGRAVTSVMVPMRPDLNQALLEYGQKEEGRKGFFNQWVIDSLVEDDVVVVDLFDKVYEGTYVGGNLSTAIAARTKMCIRDRFQRDEGKRLSDQHGAGLPCRTALLYRYPAFRRYKSGSPELCVEQGETELL